VSFFSLRSPACLKSQLCSPSAELSSGIKKQPCTIPLSKRMFVVCYNRLSRSRNILRLAMTLVGLPIFFLFLLFFSILVYFSAHLQRTAGQFLCVIHHYLFQFSLQLLHLFEVFSSCFSILRLLHFKHSSVLLLPRSKTMQLLSLWQVCVPLVVFITLFDVSYAGIILLAMIIYMYVKHLSVTRSTLTWCQGI
jgi:hypothetical protein